jgi:hypothetical protein
MRNLGSCETASTEPGPEIAVISHKPGETGGKVNVLSKGEFRALADANSWSLDYAKGYVDGETFRLRGKQPSNYALIGIDEYCLGFRAGYYERENPRSTTSLSDLPATGQ